MNALSRLQEHGQSFWIDYIRRELLTSGEVQRLVRDDGLKGMTSNPSIFEHAIRTGGEYAEALEQRIRRGVANPVVLYEQIVTEDVRMAADELRSVYDATAGLDGYVSLEVSPHLAHHTDATIKEARRLWTAVGRPNLMIKVPGTPAGFPAVEALIREGIHVNVTLLFSHEMYLQAAEAYARGLEQRVRDGADPASVASVASFFVSRIDSAVDPLLQARAEQVSAEQRRELEAAQGRVAVAWAKRAYRLFKGTMGSRRWQELLRAGARPQRLVWASTSTKNPRYSDVLYVEQLIGPETVNTIPPDTIKAFREHGNVERTLEAGLEEAEATIAVLERAAISMAQVTEQLLTEGVEKFVQPYDALLRTVAEARSRAQR